MTKKTRNGIVLKWTTFCTVIGLIAAAVAAHFNGIAEGKEYTDGKVHELRVEQMQEMKEVKEHVQQSRTDITVVREILERHYGVR